MFWWGDPVTARRALASGGLEVEAERDVLIHDIEDRPGAFGDVSRRLSDGGVNIDLAYLATRTRLVIGADDLDKARATL